MKLNGELPQGRQFQSRGGPRPDGDGGCGKLNDDYPERRDTRVMGWQTMYS